MTRYEKKKKVAMIAAAYYVEQEKLALVETTKVKSLWAGMAKELTMGNRMMVQRRGRVLRIGA